MIMNKGNWISTKDRMPKKGESIIVTLLYKGNRQYWVMENGSFNRSDSKLYYGSSECDYWQPLELIKD